MRVEKQVSLEMDSVDRTTEQAVEDILMKHVVGAIENSKKVTFQSVKDYKSPNLESNRLSWNFSSFVGRSQRVGDVDIHGVSLKDDEKENGDVNDRFHSKNRSEAKTNGVKNKYCFKLKKDDDEPLKVLFQETPKNILKVLSINRSFYIAK